MTLGDLLNNLAAKNGLQNDPKFVELLSAASISTTTVDDDFARRLDSALMSLDGAKNNKDLLSHFKAITLNPFDNKMAILGAKYGIDFGDEKSSYKKLELLEAALEKQIADAKKDGGNGNETIKSLQNQLAELQKRLTDSTTAKDAEIAQLKADFVKKELDYLISFELKGKKYANKDLGDVNYQVARAILENALAEKGGVLINDNGTIRVKQKENNTLDLLDEGNKPIQFAEFLDSQLAAKKMLEITKPAQKPYVVPGGGSQTADTSAIDAAFDAAIAGN